MNGISLSKAKHQELHGEMEQAEYERVEREAMRQHAHHKWEDGTARLKLICVVGDDNLKTPLPTLVRSISSSDDYESNQGRGGVIGVDRNVYVWRFIQSAGQRKRCDSSHEGWSIYGHDGVWKLKPERIEDVKDVGSIGSGKRGHVISTATSGEVYTWGAGGGPWLGHGTALPLANPTKVA